MDTGSYRRAAVRALSLALLLACVLPDPASAQQRQRPGRAAQQQQQQQGASRPMMPPSERPREAAWRGRQQQHDHGRMSDEERQQLRRDISDHGRDIYGDRARKQQ